MLETILVCLMRVAGGGTILAMNIAALDMVEAERAEQMVDESWYDRAVPDAQAACRDFIERASHGERGSFECQITRLSGAHRTVLMGAVRAPVDADGVPSALVVVRDLEQIRGLEAGLEQYRQKLGALETALKDLEAKQSSVDLTAEHAVWEQAEATRRQEYVDKHRAESEAAKQALTAAAARCEQLAADHEADRTEWQQQLAAGKVQEAALKRQFLAISRKQQRTTRTMDLNAAIDQLGPVLSRLVGEDIEFGVEPAAQLDPVKINPDHVEQLLLRLAVVVREAMPAGGTVPARNEQRSARRRARARLPGRAARTVCPADPEGQRMGDGSGDARPRRERRCQRRGFGGGQGAGPGLGASRVPAGRRPHRGQG